MILEAFVMGYKTAEIDGLKLFFREAGPSEAPAVLLLHGFPSSSHMYRDLMPRLADRYHVIAPDYPGYGYSEAPSVGRFTYRISPEPPKAPGT
jgi:pimeloyl-ACP methyl ester carboxylesterase